MLQKNGPCASGIMITMIQTQICLLKGKILLFYNLVFNALVQYSFHNKLKNNPRYLNHCANRRCDDLIEVLLSFEEDMFHDRKRKEVLLSPTDATLKVEGTSRHISGKLIPDTSVRTQVSIILYNYNISTPYSCRRDQKLYML